MTGSAVEKEECSVEVECLVEAKADSTVEGTGSRVVGSSLEVSGSKQDSELQKVIPTALETAKNPHFNGLSKIRLPPR